MLKQPSFTVFLHRAPVLLILLLTACGGGGGSTTAGGVTGPTPGTPPAQPAVGSIGAAVAAAEAEPYLTGSTVMHYCDCQSGNAIQPAAGCVAGSDTSGDGSAANPFRSLVYPGWDQMASYAAGDRVSYVGGDYVSLIDNNVGNFPSALGTNWAYINPSQPEVAAATWLNSRTSGNNTVALCQGGVWNTSAGNYSLNLGGNTYCPAGQTCSEFREYPLGGSGAKPVIYNSGSDSHLFVPGSGQRFMNLKIVGTGTGAGSAQIGFFFYTWVPSGPPPGVHDDTIWNVDMDGFDIPVQIGTSQSNAITIKGNHITNSTSMGFLGSCNNLDLSYNYFKDNGSDNQFDHSIYIGSHLPVSGINALGNYIEGFSTTSGAATCLGGPFVMHGEFNDVVVSGNTIIEDPDRSGPGCWGLSANHGGYSIGAYLRNARFSDNIIVNGGNLGLAVDNCPGCLIENNLIIQDNPTGGLGIAAPSFGARRILTDATTPACDSAAVALGAVCEDDPTTNYTIRNNTIYFSPNASNGLKAGIYLGVSTSTEPQSGHRIYNNSVIYAATSHGLQMVNCFGYPLASSAYDLIDNNHCYSADSTVYWEGTMGPAPTYTITRHTLAEWNALGFDSANPAAVSSADPGFFLSGYPYINRTDAAIPAELFNDGSLNNFSPVGTTLSGAGRAGSTQDITGALRSDPPAIGAYQ